MMIWMLSCTPTIATEEEHSEKKKKEKKKKKKTRKKKQQERENLIRFIMNEIETLERPSPRKNCLPLAAQ
jgi:hypothetical protein